jgi:hypothetical protein
MGENIISTKEIMQILSDLDKVVGLQVNTETDKCTFTYHHQNAASSHSIDMTNKKMTSSSV